MPIFNLNAIGNCITRYDGTGNGMILLSNIGAFNQSMYDLATDSQGNFYLYFTTQQIIVAFNPNGIAIDTFSTSIAQYPSGPGLAIVGDRVYTVIANNLYEGIKTGNTINFSLIKNIGFPATDLAACPNAGLPLFVSEDNPIQTLSIYPNPFSNILNIAISNHKNYEIIIYDVLSKKHLQQQFSESLSLNTVQLAKGIYLYEVRNKNGVIKHGKIVKE